MRIRTLAVAAAAGALLLAVPAPPAQAQDGFLFRPPVAQLTLRAGPILPRAQGDLFDFMMDTLTLGRQDFRAALLSAELAFSIAPRWDVAVGAGWAETTAPSEFRFWEHEDGRSITQETRLRFVPVTVSGRFYPLERGRRVSRLAWLPAQTTPYVGAGAGVTWYGLRQEGEFIDADRVIFPGTRESNGHGFTAHALGGLDHWFTPRVALNAEVRYAWGSAGVGGDYQGWDGLDLSGVQFAIGISYRW